MISIASLPQNERDTPPVVLHSEAEFFIGPCKSTASPPDLDSPIELSTGLY